MQSSSDHAHLKQTYKRAFCMRRFACTSQTSAHPPSARSPEPPSSSPAPRRRDGTTLPDGPFECEATRQGRQHGALSNVSNALAACLSTAPARPVVHQPLIEQQVTLCRLAAGAARRSAAAACIEWCLQTTRPAAPEGRGSSSTGRMPKERPPGRPGRGRERAASMSSSTQTKTKRKKRYEGPRLTRTPVSWDQR